MKNIINITEDTVAINKGNYIEIRQRKNLESSETKNIYLTKDELTKIINIK